jgi:TPR repeat protein/predicted Ser/Thr protein kinase
VGCLAAEDVQLYVEGVLSPEQRGAIESHALQCSVCGQLLALAATSGSDGAPAPLPVVIGARIGRFVVQGLLGTGAMGVVYAARDPELDRPVALKLVREDSTARRERLAREAQALARVSHPNVCAVYDIGTHDGQLFIAMELVDGSTLARWMRERPRGVREVLPVFVAAARGLAAAHGAGVVHRDFKPDNVLLGNDGRVRVTDFGLATMSAGPDAHVPGGSPSPASPALTRAGAIVGTPFYMSPEQHAGQAADERSDQFSFAAALYEALHGRRPFAGRTLEHLAEDTREGRILPPPAGARVPGWLDRAVRRALSPRPEARFPSMGHVADLLERRRVRGWRWAAVTVAIAAAVLLLALLATRERDPAGRCDAGDAEACLEAAALLEPRVEEAVGARLAALYHDGCDEGSVRACVRLAGLHARGFGVPPSAQRALPLYLDACDRGDAEGCARLGAFYEKGTGVLAHAGRALELYGRACAAGDGRGCVGLGDLARRGFGRQRDPKQALARYREGCARGAADGCSWAGVTLRFGLGVTADQRAGDGLLARGVELARTGCRAGVAEDCAALGTFLVKGWGARRDAARGFAAFQRACDGGDGRACAQLGDMLVAGFAVPRDPARGASVVDRGCARGETRSCSTLAFLHLMGEVAGADAARGRVILEQACAAAVTECGPLGLVHELGLGGVPRDIDRALDLYGRACAVGDGLACYWRARARGPGGVGTPDAGEERALMELSCQLGEANGCEALAMIDQREGRAEAAFAAFQKSCGMGPDQSCRRLAEAYLTGTGIARDVNRGVAILQDACSSGEGRSCRSLGALHRDGADGVTASPFLAADWFRIGCEKLDAESCLAAAELYAGDRGIAADPERAAGLRRSGCSIRPDLCPSPAASPPSGRAR